MNSSEIVFAYFLQLQKQIPLMSKSPHPNIQMSASKSAIKSGRKRKARIEDLDDDDLENLENIEV